MDCRGRCRESKRVTSIEELGVFATANHLAERKRELREVVENSQAQVDELRKELKEAQSKATESTTALESAKSALENALPFESEVKEKNLLIGKLRHEAVILNDHLTKALRYLKKGKPEDNIDKWVAASNTQMLPLLIFADNS